MQFDILTIFPDFFRSPLETGILKKAADAGFINTRIHNIRDWSADKHRCVDDTPYGGGGGMVMSPEPLLGAIRHVRKTAAPPGEPGNPQLVYLGPQGEPLTCELADQLISHPGLILLCGNYEGIDERIVEMEVDLELSIGDYVLTGGEPAALVLLNVISRRIPGVLGNPASAINDSFEDGLLDFPHYTRPASIEDRRVPEVLLSGHHEQILKWRRHEQVIRTAQRRPDLLPMAELTDEELELISGLNLLPDNLDPT
jgi:tRNA (guanine37-N1)-methyltransferase